MSNPGDTDQTPITSVRQLADYLAGGCKPSSAFRIGTEHEKFGFSVDGFQPPPYEPRGIRAVLETSAGPAWLPILDRGKPIGLKGEGKWRGASISLEPGGQYELSGAPLVTLHETAEEFASHFSELHTVSAGLGLRFAPLGFHPVATRAQIPWMPKRRYEIMRRYMPIVGTFGHDMMLRTCTVQVNLDYDSEPDMIRKLRVGLALQSVATALFANSPFTEGKPNGFLSMRAEVWTDTDRDRTGIPGFIFEDGFGFERFVEWVIDVPMYFITRDGITMDVAGASFRRFMTVGLPQAPTTTAFLGDFIDHLTTIFTDVRLKRFLEMRGADAGSPEMMIAQSAFWVGLLYAPGALQAATDLISGLRLENILAARAEVPKLGLAAMLGRRSVRDTARDALRIAESGLAWRKALDAGGNDECRYLDPLRRIVDGAPTQAEHWLHRYATAWAGDVRHIFTEAAI